MNETRTIATKETGGAKKLHPNSSPFTVVFCYSSPSCVTTTPLPQIFISIRLPLHLLLHRSFFLKQTILRRTLYLDTLLPASPHRGSHLGIRDTVIHPGFVLLQKGVGRPPGSTLIAVWEHGAGLLSTFLFFSPIVLFFGPHLFPLQSIGPSHLTPPHLSTHKLCFSFASCLSFRLPRHHTSIWRKLPTVGPTWTGYAETRLLEIDRYYCCMPWWPPLSSATPFQHLPRSEGAWVEECAPFERSQSN